MSNNNELTTKPISGLIAKLAIPASVGMFFNTMYNVVDTWFSGLISTEAIAAPSLSFPVFFVILAIGFGISTGTTALIANALGAGDEDTILLQPDAMRHPAKAILQPGPIGRLQNASMGVVGYKIVPGCVFFCIGLFIQRKPVRGHSGANYTPNFQLCYNSPILKPGAY